MDTPCGREGSEGSEGSKGSEGKVLRIDRPDGRRVLKFDGPSGRGLRIALGHTFGVRVLKMDRPLAGGFLSLTAFQAEGCGIALSGDEYYNAAFRRSRPHRVS